jgi:hypothetical protein
METGSTNKPGLRPGRRVRVSGGYDMDPAWLGGADGCVGTVERFIPGQNDTPAVVVRLDHAISARQTTGQVLVLELRHERASWQDGVTVHVELCSFDPEDARWQDRRRGEWIESHATIATA